MEGIWSGSMELVCILTKENLDEIEVCFEQLVTSLSGDQNYLKLKDHIINFRFAISSYKDFIEILDGLGESQKFLNHHKFLFQSFLFSLYSLSEQVCKIKRVKPKDFEWIWLIGMVRGIFHQHDLSYMDESVVYELISKNDSSSDKDFTDLVLKLRNRKWRFHFTNDERKLLVLKTLKTLQSL